jgi:hypothetical protein
MNTHPDQRLRYGDWRDMIVEELPDWLHLHVTSGWRHVTLMDLYVDHQTKGGLNPQQGRTAGAAGTSESPKTLQRTALGHIAEDTSKNGARSHRLSRW